MKNKMKFKHIEYILEIEINPKDMNKKIRIL